MTTTEATHTPESEWCGYASPANARLIAAAPQLLEALCRLVGGNGHEGDLYDPEAHALARAAIAATTGE